eukprot:1125379-Amphidinium_carterae.1
MVTKALPRSHLVACFHEVRVRLLNKIIPLFAKGQMLWCPTQNDKPGGKAYPKKLPYSPTRNYYSNNSKNDKN